AANSVTPPPLADDQELPEIALFNSWAEDAPPILTLSIRLSAYSTIRRLYDDRPPALRRRRRLVREPVQPAESPRRAARAHRPARRRARARGDADRSRAVGRPFHLYDGAWERPFFRPGAPVAAALPGAGRLPPR